MYVRSILGVSIVAAERVHSVRRCPLGLVPAHGVDCGVEEEKESGSAECKAMVRAGQSGTDRVDSSTGKVAATIAPLSLGEVASLTPVSTGSSVFRDAGGVGHT